MSRVGVLDPAPARALPACAAGLVQRCVRWWRLWQSLAALLCACFWLGGAPLAALANERIELRDVRLEPQDEYWQLTADFRLELTARLEEAVNRGLPLYFAVEFEMTRPRWYWFDEKTVSAVINYRLSYNALTRQYRVSTGSLQLGFPSLAEAIGVMTRVRNWRVAERGVIKPGDTYQAAVRMRLDVSQLPKPFQINAVTDRDWTMESEWRRFTVGGEAAR